MRACDGCSTSLVLRCGDECAPASTGITEKECVHEEERQRVHSDIPGALADRRDANRLQGARQVRHVAAQAVFADRRLQGEKRIARLPRLYVLCVLRRFPPEQRAPLRDHPEPPEHRFELWLMGQNEATQKAYWNLLKDTEWNEGVEDMPHYSVLETVLVDDPDFSDLPALSDRIEQSALRIIDGIRPYIA